MNELFLFIKARINHFIPELRTIRMWNAQTYQSNDLRKEKAFPYPACFVEFITEEVQTLSLGIKNLTLTVRFRFALESFKFERLQNLDFQDTFDAAIQGFRGNEVDAVQFSTMQEIGTELDEDFENVNEPYIDYRTIWRKQSAYYRKGDFLKPGVTAQVVVGDVYTFDESELTPVFLYNESENKPPVFTY